MDVEQTNLSPYIPTDKEREAQKEVSDTYLSNRNVVWKSYNQFNGRTLYEAIDDWTKRWNGFLPPLDPLLSSYQSNIFLNFTRNVIISYLAKVALNQPKVVFKAVNKKTGIASQKFAEILKDLNTYSSEAENGAARFLEAALEVATKGTVVVYEGYMRTVNKKKVPVDYNAETGEIEYKEEEVVEFDNCYQRVWPLEDVYISNVYQPDIQKQPKIVLREITTYDEAFWEFGHFKKWKHVKPGQYTLASDPTTFYRNKLVTDLSSNQVEILRYYCKKDNRHIIQINGVILYDGPIPFKDGKYPLAKTICEPYANDFFFGMPFTEKFMGEQDLQNSFINMMADKTYGSLTPFGMTSDIDDLIEDEILQPNKIRKVSNINNWRFETLPGVSSGEQSMFQIIMNLARENSGNIMGAGNASTPRGGKIPVRQMLLQQQEALQKLGFSMNYLEDLERDRVEIRTHHILQFYSIPKIEKITGKRGKEIEQLVYRDVKLSNVKLSDGSKGNKIIKLVDSQSTDDADERKKLEDDLAVTEEMGYVSGTPTEAIALSVDTFYDWNFDVSVVKGSSYEKNQVLDQASRQEYANWRIGLTQIAPANVPAIIKWVDEAFDVPTEEFEMKPGENQQAINGQQQGQQVAPQGAQPQTQPPQGQAPQSPQAQVSPANLSITDKLIG